MTKVFIATPSYDGKVHAQYAVALSETANILAANGVHTSIQIPCGGSLLVAARNMLCREFLLSDCTHLFFIDSDIGWPAQAVTAMLLSGKDIVAGIYPAKVGNEFLYRPVMNEDGSLVRCGNLIKMDYIPSGFMLMKREVIEKMNNDNPQLYYKPKKGPLPDGYCLFNTEIYEGEFWGEDYVFCRNARRSGFDIWVDPLIQFDHAGVRGALIQALTEDASQALIPEHSANIQPQEGSNDSEQLCS